jgi:hypothetical protein
LIFSHSCFVIPSEARDLIFGLQLRNQIPRFARDDNKKAAVPSLDKLCKSHSDSVLSVQNGLWQRFLAIALTGVVILR